METVTFKLHENILKKLDKVLRPLNFSNRTEFIREAIRDKLNSIEEDPIIRELRKFKGAAKVHVSDKRLHEIREKVFQELDKKLR